MTKIIPKHISWLIDTGEKILTSEGKIVQILELRHQNDPIVLSDWAKHFRNHYCLDDKIDLFRKGTSLSRSDYLTSIKFPDHKEAPGPSVRAGDFGEILVADYLEFSLEYWVPRTRYCDKTSRNESSKGSDVLGFKFTNEGSESIDDILAIFETKSQFTGSRSKSKLQEAVNDSIKDQIRKAESLNAVKQRLHHDGLVGDAAKIQRFQNHVDHPYREVSGAAALFSNTLFDKQIIKSTKVINHPKANDLVLLVIKGVDMMNLVHDLYRRAANEA